jgi:hypothetical protein
MGSARTARARRLQRRRLAAVRSLAGLGPDLSVPRVIDVLTWMVGKGYAGA